MEDVGEPVGELEPISEETVIEKPKKILKMRETHSAAQLETLRRGRKTSFEKSETKRREATSTCSRPLTQVRTEMQ